MKFSLSNLVYIYLLSLTCFRTPIFDFLIIFLFILLILVSQKFESRWFRVTAILMVINVLSIVVSRNDNWLFFILRVARYCASSYILLYLISRSEGSRLKKVSVNLALTHGLIIIVSYVWPPLNAFLHVILAKSTVLSAVRCSGLFEGYDYAAYFLSIFYINFAVDKKRKDIKSFVILAIGLVALVITGRTGLFFAALITFVFLLKNRLLFSPVAILGILVIGAVFFNKILYSIYSVGLIDKGDFYQTADGYYDMSFFQVLGEWLYLLTNLPALLFGSSVEYHADPGPVFIIGNLGLMAYISYWVAYVKGNRIRGDRRGFLNILITIIGEFKINVLLSRSVGEYSLLVNMAENKVRDEADSDTGS